MPLAIIILAIIGAITLLCLFCLTALFVACHVLYLWQRPPRADAPDNVKEQGTNEKIVYSIGYKK